MACGSGRPTGRRLTASSSGRRRAADGGWLVLDKSLQDVQIGFDVRCTSGCRIGVLLRAEKTANGGLKGVFASLVEDDIAGYAVTLDANGRELTRERLRAGGGMMRFAPTAAEAAAAAAAAAARGGGRGAAGGRGGGGRGAQPGPLKADDWNDIDIVLDANILRPIVNGRPTGGGAADEDAGKFGPVALYVGGDGRGALPRRRLQGSRGQAVPEGRAVAELPHAAPDAVLLLVLGRRGRHQPRRPHGRHLRSRSSTTDLTSRTAREFYAGADDQPVDAVLAQLGGVRRRLHRRRLARRPPRLDRQQPALRQPAGRGAALGHLSRHHPAGQPVRSCR